MDNRKRNNQLKIYLTDEEKEVFDKKMKLANCKSMSHFLRKCVLEKEIYVVDLEHLETYNGCFKRQQVIYTRLQKLLIQLVLFTKMKLNL